MASGNVIDPLRLKGDRVRRPIRFSRPAGDHTLRGWWGWQRLGDLLTFKQLNLPVEIVVFKNNALEFVELAKDEPPSVRSGTTHAKGAEVSWKRLAKFTNAPDAGV